MTALPQRKPPRLPGYDYCTAGAYFITICAKNRRCIFGSILPTGVGGDACIAPQVTLTPLGRLVQKHLSAIPGVTEYVVMPNHIHLILTVKELEMKNERIGTVSLAIRNIKMNISKQLHNLKIEDSIWQRSFHDHIIRNEKEYQMIWQYIENNPRKWAEDCFYNKR